MLIQESDVRLEIIHKATAILDQRIADIQQDRKELREKLETAEKERHVRIILYYNLKEKIEIQHKQTKLTQTI